MRGATVEVHLPKRYVVPAIAFGVLGGYLVSRSDYVWATLALTVCVVLLICAVLIAKGERT